MNSISDAKDWDLIIEPPKGRIHSHFKDLKQFKYLIFLFVKRDFQTAFKQTILGPLWFVIQPLMTTGVFTIIFSGIAQISTDEIPPPVFYLAGQVIWGFFTNVLTANAGILADNAGLFSKVYFPRLAVPIANTFSKLYNFVIQLLLFVVMYVVYIVQGAPMAPNWWIFAIPLAMLQLALVGLGFGFWASAWTVKYRDLKHLISFGVQLWMYGTPIVYPMSFATNELLRKVIWINPAAQAVELFRFAFTGKGTISLGWILYSSIFAILIFFFGLSRFSKAERTYVDVV